MSATTKPRVVFLMGPTATGKTDLAVALSAHFPIEIVSVDSALVYRQMDIGTAKPEQELRDRVPHHLLDILDPSEAYSAADFARDARRLMADIIGRGRVPVLAGGTMLYFNVLLQGLAALPASDPAVREAISDEAERLGWPAMHRQLAEVDPETAAALHPNHSRRIQRALEIYRQTGIAPSEIKARQQEGEVGVDAILDDFDVTQIALLPQDRQFLHQRIADRFAHMLELGFEDEVKRLRSRGDLHTGLPAIRAVGYRQMWDYLDGLYDYEQMVAKAIAATRQLAKRQLTWLRGWPDLNEIYIDDGSGRLTNREELLAQILKILESGTIY